MLKWKRPKVRFKFKPAKLLTDKKEDGWKLIQNNNSTGECSLGVVELLMGVPTSVSSPLEINNKSNLGQLHAEQLMEDQKVVPWQWRQFILIFPGTLWENSFGERRVPHMIYANNRWNFGYSSVKLVANSQFRIVRRVRDAHRG